MQVYAVCYGVYSAEDEAQGKGKEGAPNGHFLMATKLARGYFFRGSSGKGKIVNRGKELNGGGFPAFPGGKKEEKEDNVGAALREFFEETGQRVDDLTKSFKVTEANFPVGKKAEYAAVYFSVDDLWTLTDAVNTSLQIGIRAQYEIIQAGALSEYKKIVEGKKGCPYDNELASARVWQIGYDWSAIQQWENNDIVGWYYVILNYFREEIYKGKS